MARQRVQWADSTAGMSSDEYFGPKGSFWDCKNIDPTLNAGYSVISSSITSTIGSYNTRANGYAIGALIGTSATNAMALGADGVFENSFNVGGAPTYTIPGGVGYNVVVHNQYGVLIGLKSSGVIGIYRWVYDPTDVNNGVGIGVAGANISEACNFTQTAGSRVVFLDQPTGFYVGTANKVWYIDTTTGTWGAINQLSIGTSEDIVAMTEIADQIIIYANNGSNGRQYFWNKIDKSYQRVINWYDRPFINVANLNNIDTAFVGTNEKRQAYMAMGYQPQLLKTSIPNNYDRASGIKRLFFSPSSTNAIDTMTQRIFVPDDVGNIYSIGNTIPGLPQSIHKQYFVDGTVKTLYFNETSGMNLYVFFTSTSYTGTTGNYMKVFRVGNSGGYRDGTAYITRNKFYGPYQGLNKQSAKIKHSAKLLSTSEKIYLMTNTDSDLTYISAFTGSDENNYTTRFDFQGVPIVGDIYTGGGLTWKVIYSDVALVGSLYLGAVTFQITAGTTAYPLRKQTLTRTSGTGPTTIKIRDTYFGKIQSFTQGSRTNSDIQVDVKTQTQIIPGDFKEIQVSQVYVCTGVISNVGQPSAFGEVTMAYDVIKDDLT